MVPCLICYFVVILFYIVRKWLLMRNLTTALPLRSKLCGKFQLFNALDGSINMLKNSRISKTFNQNEARTASCLKKIIQFPQKPQTTPNQIKSYYIFGIKIFLQRYTEIYRHLLPKCFKNTVFGRQEMVQRKCLF